MGHIEIIILNKTYATNSCIRLHERSFFFKMRFEMSKTITLSEFQGLATEIKFAQINAPFYTPSGESLSYHFVTLMQTFESQ